MSKLETGIEYTIDYKVEEKDSARNIGSGLLDVFSTPAMIALMEKCSMTLVQESLDKGFGTVGTMVNIKHLKATRIGENVRAIAKVVEIDNKRLRFEVNVYEGDKLIGTGEHERFIIDEEKFLSRL
jgi:predicted thioesterase